ncbi:MULTISPECIES: glycosyl hydrolase family 18 protein [Bacillus]|uniref:Spore gernimation protein n=2 Tax=Bacillus TaxID=1386 RepID=A0A0M3R9E0_9BACI|nr:MULTISPECIES: glycosyl hydrolase family 18 protein [Bacillus]ALC81256.1 spore gernimation protein [Bacillus gobiensis]MBP1080258.1 spore germination protein [Bacillus capparidis]MED1094125.1 glycosyl hydrolase family 18 protein [Bacillus capparidis]
MKKSFTLIFSLTLVLTACTGNNENSGEAQDQTNPQPRVHQIKTETNQSKTKEVNPSETAHGNHTIDSIGFLEPVDPKQAVSEVNNVGKHLSYVAFFSYRAQEDGNLIPIKDDEALPATRKNGAAAMMVVTNFTEGNFSPDVAHKIFTDKTASKRFIQKVIQTMKAKGYKALNIDFEHIRAEDRDLYNGFLETLIPQVRKAGFKVSTALAPKTSDEQSGPWHGAHDYKHHGEIADFVILMTYEWGWSGGPPMAVSPIPQVKKVIDYALSVIPREKIVMGAPLYGYDWTLPYEKGGKFAKRIAPKEAAELAIKEGAEIKFDNEAQAPHFNYRDDNNKEHTVWYENEQSAQAKFNLVKEYRLRGIAYWVLGEPFPQNWSMLEDQFTIKKEQ